MWKRLRIDRLTSSAQHTSLNSFKPWTVLAEQRAELRNLHQYPTARHKSLVRDRLRFARNWWLTGGNNYELVHEVGHEREATECFAEYAQDSSKDVYLLSTNRLDDLPPRDRLNAIVGLMRSRWRVKDANRGYDKAKLLLRALECFSEMRLSGQIGNFDSLPEPDQDTFLQYVEGCSRFAQACSHSHPEAVRILLRAAQICEELRCEGKRDEMIQVAEGAANRMDRAYAFSRPQDTLRPGQPSVYENEQRIRLKGAEELRKRYAHSAPHVLKEPERVECLRIHRNRPLLLRPMKDDNKLLELSKVPMRPEFDPWTSHST